MAQRKSGIKERAENRSKETLKRKNLSKRIVRESIDFDKIIASNDPQTIFNAMWEQLDKRLLENKHFQGYLGYVEGYNEAVKCCQDYIENKLNIRILEVINVILAVLEKIIDSIDIELITSKIIENIEDYGFLIKTHDFKYQYVA